MGFVVCVAAVVTSTAVAASLSFHGSITSDDPDQKGRLVGDDPATSCTASTAPALAHSEPTNHDLYGFRNTSNSTQCVTVELVPDPLLCPIANSLQSAAYSPEFDPADITANYLGDLGVEKPEPSKSYSFNVPAATAFQVAVNETNPDAGCNGYTLTVSGDGITPGPPTAVVVLSFTVTRARRGGVRLRWRTSQGADVVGFNAYREQAGRRIRLNRRLIRTRGGGALLDRFQARSYWLEVVAANGVRTWHGPARLGA